jgi:hypothetical protein
MDLVQKWYRTSANCTKNFGARTFGQVAQRLEILQPIVKSSS